MLQGFLVSIYSWSSTFKISSKVWGVLNSMLNFLQWLPWRSKARKSALEMDENMILLSYKNMIFYVTLCHQEYFNVSTVLAKQNRVRLHRQYLQASWWACTSMRIRGTNPWSTCHVVQHASLNVIVLVPTCFEYCMAGLLIFMSWDARIMNKLIKIEALGKDWILRMTPWKMLL
jgi:hypothetical protein